MTRLRYLVCFFLLSAGTCVAQTSYQGLTPDTSTRADVEKSFGQPARTEGRVSEYHPPAGSGVASIVVQYKTDSTIVERIEVYFPSAVDRSALIRTLGLPEKPKATKTVDGKLVECFASPQWLVLTYAAAKQTDGVSNVGYYSPQLFNWMVGDQAAKPTASDSTRAKPSSAGLPIASAAKSAGGDPSQAKPSGSTAPTKSFDNTPHSNSGPPSETTASAGRTDDSAPNVYSGPSSGTITWSGKTDQDQVIAIEGDHSASGSVEGGLPGVPVQVDLDTREYAVVEAPAPSNGWKRLSVRSKHKRQAVISIRWVVLQ